MGKRKNPVVLENCLSISIRDIRSLGLLKGGYGSIEVKFSRGKKSMGESSMMVISASIESECSYIELEYKVNGKPTIQRIPLIAIKANLPNSSRLSFHCKKTGVSCCKLHLHDGLFVHRTGIPHGRYLSQCISLNNRWAFKKARMIQSIQKIRNMRGNKHFKTHYRGKLTKKQLKVIRANRELSIE